MTRDIREVWLATPAHDRPSMGFAQSFQPTVSELTRLGLKVVPRVVSGQAHIDLIRSQMASRFLRSPAESDVLLFADSDEEWAPGDIAILLEAIAEGLDVVGACVPGKFYDWEQIRLAAVAGASSSELAAAGLVYNYELDAADVDEDRGYVGPRHILGRSETPLVRVKHVGTGLLALHRDALEGVADAYPELTIDAPFPGPVLFKSDILKHPTGRRHETEDFTFLYRYRKLGGTIWLHYRAQVGHEGLHTWRGDGSEASLERQAKRYARIVKTPSWRDYQYGMR